MHFRMKDLGRLLSTLSFRQEGDGVDFRHTRRLNLCCQRGAKNVLGQLREASVVDGRILKLSQSQVHFRACQGLRHKDFSGTASARSWSAVLAKVGDEFNRTDDAVVEFLQIGGRNPVFLML
jgi:hypothetical protein